MALPRSYLFVPADCPERFDKALDSGADAVIVDLEDAVAPSAKNMARNILASWLRQQPHAQAAVWIRINAAGTPWHDDDLALIQEADIAGVVLPKAEQVDDVRAVVARLSGKQQLSLLIESAAGIAAMRALAQVDKVQRLMFGSLDLQLDLGMPCDPQESELAHFRMELVLASRLAGIAPPVDGVTVALGDEVALNDAVLRARRMGFRAKLCIHPRQVETVNRSFLPDDQQLDWARRVLAVVEGSNGAAVALDGKMIDAPVIALARRIVEEAGR